MLGLLFPGLDALLCYPVLAVIHFGEMGFMDFVAILVIGACILSALFNLWKLCAVVTGLIRYLRHPNRDFLNHVREVATSIMRCRDCGYVGPLAWKEGVEQEPVEAVPDRDLFCCDQCGGDRWDLQGNG